MRALAVLLALALLALACGRYGSPVRQPRPSAVSSLPAQTADAEECEETEQTSP